MQSMSFVHHDFLINKPIIYPESVFHGCLFPRLPYHVSDVIDLIVFLVSRIAKFLIMIRLLLFLTVTIVSLLYGISSISGLSKRNDPSFRAAVYEHQRFTNRSEDQFQVKKINLKSYAKAAQIAAYHEAKVIVFPESGLFNADSRLIALSNYEYIPSANESAIPCIDWETNGDVRSSSFAVYSLSCIARGFNIYLAAILGEKVECSRADDPDCPPDGHYLYNTQIFFDATGKLIAKYHKYHLFFESAHNKPKQPEVVTIDTPFGRFGFLICFDIHFEQPALSYVYEKSVDTLLFGAHWIDETPFLHAHRVQAGFAIEHNINLLAAGVNDLPNGAVGSGIYEAGKGPITYTADIRRAGSRLLIADLPVTRKRVDQNEIVSTKSLPFVRMFEKFSTDERDNNYIPWTIELDLYNRTLLTDPSGSLTLCTETVCCDLDYSLNSPRFTDTYYLIAKRWIRPSTKICEQFCGLVAYDVTDYAYSSMDIFSHVRLTGTFAGNLSLPSVITNDFQLISKSKWDYQHNGNTATISFDQVNEPLVAATLYSRCEKDDQPFENGIH